MPGHDLGSGASKSPGNPTWTHLWLVGEPQSGIAGTGVGILATSALSPRGTQWHPVRGGEKWRPFGSSQSLSYPLFPTLGFINSRVP